VAGAGRGGRTPSVPRPATVGGRTGGIVYLFAASAALVNAVTSVLQRMWVETAPADTTMHLSLITHALRRGIWLLGLALMPLTFVLSAIALRFGQLSVVQPVLTTELLFLEAILVTAFHYRLGWRELVGSGTFVVGLGAFFVIADPSGGGLTPRTSSWLVATAVVVAAVVAGILAARTGPRWWRAAAFGAATAVTFAFNAALTKSLTIYITEGWGHVFTHVEPYAIVVTGIFGVFLLQNALHAGPITASRTTLLTVNPLVGIALGLALFGDHLATSGPRVPLEVLALATMVAGIVVLARSPLVAGPGDPTGPGESLTAARRHARRPEPVVAPVDAPVDVP